MQFKASKIRLQYNENNQAEIVLTTNENSFKVRQEVSELKEIIASGKELSAEIKQYRKKRSLDANSYAWLLITKIADVLKTSKEEVYIEMLKRYGQREPKLLSVISEAVDMVFRATNNHCTVVGESELNGKEFKHLAILIGSSQYDSKAMATLIDGIVSEAKELGIQTMTPNEIAELKSKWGEERKVS
jgi:DNA-binding transcriptional regulator YiaG